MVFQIFYTEFFDRLPDDDAMKLIGDSIYNESCIWRPCLKAHNLKCIDKICTCESPKYYRGKCLAPSKYTEKCVFNSDCDQTQVLVCLNYSTCDCSSSMFWSTVNLKCIYRLTHGESCSGDQCINHLGLICNSGACSCPDNSRFYWNGNMCVSKKNFDQTCYSTTECMDSEATYCDGSKCTCTNMQYLSNSLSKCTRRLGEDLFLKCPCSITQYFNETINDCVDKKLNGETCLLTHHCRSDLGLTCQNNICLCKSPKYTWYSAGFECKLTYDQTTCSNDTDCNPSENLICSQVDKCDCKRVINDENYSSNHCMTLTEKTYWNFSKNKCDCYTPGGFSYLIDECTICFSDEIFKDEHCYFVSKNIANGRGNAKDRCKNDNIDGEKRESSLLAIYSVELNNFVQTIVSQNEEYWIAGKKVNNNEYDWKETSSTVVDESICSLPSNGEDCLYYRNTCFYNDKTCDKDFRFICQRIAT
ncbi:unnamed protein product [Brachionus calyciflorus]|uniref:C-type lectin domain-containing protein n=1 Tax=Brachionus calyciflorus TaxID=104777 RepID=A0A814HJS4_9BILA|nr:unnamed protein product [Brachionus calyciflorus]